MQHGHHTNRSNTMDTQRILDAIPNTDHATTDAIDVMMAEVAAADNVETAYRICRIAQCAADIRTDAGKMLNAAATRGLTALQNMDMDACRRTEAAHRAARSA